MNNGRKVHIDRLEIRLKGVAPGTARGAVDGLGEDLVRHLPPGLGGASRPARIERIDARESRIGPGMSPADLRRAIVRRIVDEIERKITQQTGER